VKERKEQFAEIMINTDTTATSIDAGVCMIDGHSYVYNHKDQTCELGLVEIINLHDIGYTVKEFKRDWLVDHIRGICIKKGDFKIYRIQSVLPDGIKCEYGDS
jgi:hypothetical protein